jgi:membrane-bound metal-dependent hydrolase YbcI (DUF457 family)
VGGVAAAFLANAAARRPRLTMPALGAAAAAAVLPDIDILVHTHRTITHSVGAIGLMGLVVWVVMTVRRAPPGTMGPGAAAAAIAAAYGSHIALDLLGKDTSPPVGLTALWPFSAAYYISGWDLFGEVSRRYWLPGEFVLGNLRAVAWEMAVLLPVLVIAWAWWSGRTLRVERRTSDVVRR